MTLPCPSCNEPIAPDDRIMHMPCCGIVGHTSCMFNFLKPSYSSIICSLCDAVAHHSHSHSHSHQDSQSIQESAPMTPALSAAFKDAKKANAAKRKALTALKAALKGPRIAFKAQTDPLINSLKAMQSEARATSKLLPEALEYSRISRIVSAKSSRLLKVFNVSYQQMRDAGLQPRSRWFAYMQTLNWNIRKNFWLRRRFVHG